MEMNLASSITHNITSSRDSCGQLIEGFNPRVQLRETRSAYFVDVNLSGFRKEAIRLEMDNTRTLIIRGHRYLQDMGKVEWTWHLMESGGRSFRKPFKVPHNVNVGAMTGSFHQGVLHVLMPKFRWTSRFTPYHINRSDSQNAEPAHPPDVSNFPQEGAKENKDDDVAQKEYDLVDTQSNAAKEADEGVARKMDDLVGTQCNAAKESDNDVVQKMDDLVDSQSNATKEAADQKSPAISTVEEQSIPQQSMRLPEACSSDIVDTYTKQANNHEEPPCLGSNVVKDMEKEKEKDDQHTQQKNDASSPPCQAVDEGLTAHQETACPLNSEAEEVNHEKHESEKVISSNVNDDYSGIIFDWNNDQPFWTRTKMVVAVVVSSVALIAAFKWMRR